MHPTRSAVPVKLSLVFFRALLFAFLCAGCIHKRSLKKLPSLAKYKQLYENYSQLTENENEASKSEQEKDDLSVYCYAYTADDCDAFFGANLLAYGYQPIQVNIVNNTSQSAFIRPGYIDREIYPSARILPLIKFDTALFVYYAGLPSLLFYWPLVPLFVAPVGYWLSKTNTDYEQLLRSHTIEEHDTVEIRPFTSLDKLVFVGTAGRPAITIQLYHQTDGALRSF